MNVVLSAYAGKENTQKDQVCGQCSAICLRSRYFGGGELIEDMTLPGRPPTRQLE